MARLKGQRKSSKRGRLTVWGFVSLLIACGAIWYWPEFCYWRAGACLASRNDQAAERWLNFCSWGQPTNARTCLMRLRLARRQNRFDDVERGLQLAVKLKIPAAELQREQWLASAQAQQFEQMQTHWTELFSDPRDDEPEIARAFVTWACSRHKLDEAHHVISVWHDDFPKDPEPLALRARLYKAANSHGSAEQAYRQALLLAPANDEYRLSLADTLRQGLKLDEALSLYQDRLKNNPENLTAVSGLAQTYTSQGKLELAIETLRGAVTRHPEDLELAQSLGEVLLVSGEDASAASELQRAYKAHPENSDLAYALGQALKGAGRESEAAPLFAFVAESREQVDQLKDLEEQLRKQPEDLALRTKIASITAKYKSRRDGIRWYENLLNINPQHAPTHAALADLYRLEGDVVRSERHSAKAGLGSSNSAREPSIQ